MSEQISKLSGKTINHIIGLEKGSERVEIETTDGFRFILYHIQDCCEIVLLEDYDIEAKELEGAYVTEAFLSMKDGKGYESSTWSFYRIITNKGTLCMRWFGTSNGYYSEKVDLDIMEPK